MTALDPFSDEHKTLLIRLPYQVGLHISHADDADGEEDDTLEMEALNKILHSLPGLYEHKPLIQEVLKETLARKSDWSSWEEGTFDLTKECSEAVLTLKEKVGKDVATAYAKMLLQIADTIARAAGEYGVFEIREEPDSGLFKLYHDLMKRLGMVDTAPLSNISAAEQEAIDRLTGALKVE